MNTPSNLKWAVPVLSALLLASAIGCSGEPQVVEKIVEVEKVVEVVVTATAVPTPEATRPAPTATSTVVPEATVQPTLAIAPTATPRPSKDYYVIIKGKWMDLYADFPSFNRYSRSGSTASIFFSNPDFLLDYLLKEGIITFEKKIAHARGESITADFDGLSVVVHKLLQSKGYPGMNNDLELSKLDLDYLLYHFDESLLASGNSESEGSSEKNETYIALGGDLIEYYGFSYSRGPLYRMEGGLASSVYSDVFLDYLFTKGLVTPEQKLAHSRGERIKIPLNARFSIALHDLVQSEGYGRMQNNYGLHDGELKNLFDFLPPVLDSDSEPLSSDNYVVIRDGSLETVVTDDDGNTTRIKIDTVDTEEFLDYLLSQGKITIKQRDEYGENRSLELSLEDVAEVFDLAVDPDNEFYMGIEKEDLNYIRDNLLPLFSFGD